MISSSKSVGAVGSETSKHSKHPVALRLFYYTVIAIVGAALLPVIPAAAAKTAAVRAPQVSSAPSAYTAVNPTRVMDTRTGSGLVGAGNTLGPGASFSLGVAPNATAGVPANATAVVMNVTATNTTAASYLTVYPTLASLPFASNLNWVAGYTVPNLVTVQPGSAGQVTFYNKFGSVDVIADIAGYYAPPSGSAGGEVGTGFPQRLVDTRAGSGKLGAGSAIGPAATATFQVTGNAGVPASGVSAVIVNVTVTNTTAASFLTLWAAGATRNTVSNANWVAGWTRANRAIVPVSSTGQISVYNQFGSVDVILDVNGYYTNSTASGKLFTSVSPLRLADHTALGPNSSFNLPIAGVAGVPLTASAAVLDVVTSETTAPSFLSVSPSPGTAGATSDINWVAGQVNPNLAVATLGTGGQANFYNSAGNANVTVDLEGFFGGGAGVNVTATPPSLPADGTSTSKVNTTVGDINGLPIANDVVVFTTSGSPTAACGTLSSASGTTNLSGVVPTITYTASTTPGTCTITATETIGGKTGTVTITQTAPPNVIAISPNSNGTSIPVDANGSTVTFTTTTTNSVTNAAVVGDTLTFTTSGGAACGTIGTILPAGGVTPANGVVTFVYTSSNVVGFCTIKATESGTGATQSVVVTQNTPGKAGFNFVTVTVPTNCSGNNDLCVLANGTDTSPVTVNVTDLFSLPVNNDSVLATTFSAGTPGSCGTLSPLSGSTNASGNFTTTYTASTTAGSCTITFTEADSANIGQLFIQQSQVPNKIVVAANPLSIVANGTSTSALTVTVTSGVGGAAVSADAVTFSTSGTCGAVSGSTTPTNTAGQVTATYTSSVTSGFCTITATDSTGASGTVTIDQTKPATSGLTTTITASKTSVPADGATTSTLTVTVMAAGVGINGDPILITFSGSPAGACPSGTLNGVTAGSGTATFTYTATNTVGTCTITATEANAGSSATTAITQTAVVNVVTVTGTSPVGVATAAFAVTALVQHNGVAVNSDTVTFTVSANPAGSCGSLSATSGNTGTGGTGTVSVNYTPSAVAGFCTITATESLNGQSGTKVIDQTNTAPGLNITTVTITPDANLIANGTDTRTVTATITGTGNHLNDTVVFTMAAGTPGSCGTLSATSGNTGTGSTVAVTYTASTTVGTCTITATEANGNSSGSHSTTQAQRPNTITLSASPTSVSTSAAGTSTLTVTVTDTNTHAGVSGDAITFTSLGSPLAACGVISANTTPTNSSGVVTATYTASSAQGGCVITAHEALTGSSSNTATIIQGP
jgi:hypothetical protein